MCFCLIFLRQPISKAKTLQKVGWLKNKLVCLVTFVHSSTAYGIEHLFFDWSFTWRHRTTRKCRTDTNHTSPFAAESRENSAKNTTHYRALKSHALGVRHTHFNPFTRSHATPCISHAKKFTPPVNNRDQHPPPRQQSRPAPPPPPPLPAAKISL